MQKKKIQPFKKLLVDLACACSRLCCMVLEDFFFSLYLSGVCMYVLPQLIISVPEACIILPLIKKGQKIW